MQQRFLGLTVTLMLFAALVHAQSAEPVTRVDAALANFVDPEGRDWSAVTDSLGQLVNGINAAGLETMVDRSAGGNALRTTLPDGSVTTRTFDNRGNVVSRTDQTLGGTTSFVYETSFNRIGEVTDALGSRTTVLYDIEGNPTRLQTPEGRVLASSYRADGLVATLTDTQGTVATIDYNSDSLPTTLTVGAGVDARSATRIYTSAGYLDIDTDAEGRVLDFDYDAFGRVIQVALPDTRAISYDYDPAGNVIGITPPGRTTYSYAYNNVGLLIAESYPAVSGGGSNQVEYEYNQTRQPTRITRADGVTVEFGYDAAGRINAIVQPNGDYKYDYSATTGQLTSLASPDGVTQNFSYNKERLTQVSWAGSLSGSVGYEYDLKGRITTLAIAGQDYDYVYNLDDDPVQAGQQALSYDANSGLLTATTLGTLNEAFTYNQFAELSRHVVTSGATTLYDVQYTRDRLGRISRAIEAIEGTTTTIDYTYDLAGRLATVTENSVLAAAFSYDSNDNRIDNGGVYDAQDRATSQTGIAYDYSPQGERTRKTEGVSVTSYQFDAQGTLIGAVLPNGNQLGYLLDGQSRRVARQINRITTEAWLYVDSLQIAARLDASSVVTQRYIYASRKTVPDYLDDGAAQYKLITNHLGSVRLVVNAINGTVVQRIDYDAWGAITADSNPSFQPFAFAGGLYDHDTGLTHFGLREYDASTGHWTSKDPIDFDGSINNLYAYASADPVNVIDPTGMESSILPNRGATVGKVAGIRGRSAWITNAGGTRLELQAGDSICVGDTISTGPETTVTLVYGIGGQSGINQNTTAEVIGLRETREVGNLVRIKARTFWQKIDKQKETLQIQTASGTIGVEG